MLIVMVSWQAPDGTDRLACVEGGMAGIRRFLEAQPDRADGPDHPAFGTPHRLTPLIVDDTV